MGMTYTGLSWLFTHSFPLLAFHCDLSLLQSILRIMADHFGCTLGLLGQNGDLGAFGLGL
jgi:hypothetical protein